MPTLGTQTISSSFAQLLKTFTTGGLDGALQVVTDGDNTSSALSLSTTGVSSTGSFSVDGASTLTGAVTFGSNITASTGTATIGTLSVSGPATFGTNITASTGTATIGTLSVSGPATFGTSITASTGTATIGTLSAGTATISTATIPLQLGNITFGSNITASTGTATIGTQIVSTSTIGTLNVSGTATVGSLEIGGTAGPLITKVSYGTAAFTLSTVQPHNLADTTTGTFALTGAELGDIVIGSINSLGSTTGTAQIMTNFYPISSNVVRYAVIGKGTTAGTVPAGTIFATAMRFTA
jgi:fibronectin-binding autotransporter adhesin